MVKKLDIIVELMKYEPCNWCKKCNGIENCNIYKSYKYNYSRMKKKDLINKLIKSKSTC